MNKFLYAVVFLWIYSVPFYADFLMTSPEKQGMDSSPLIRMLKSIEAENLPVHSVLVLRNGCLVLEAYLHPYNRQTPHNIYSCTKTITSALVGIAIHERFIEGVQSKIVELLPKGVTKDPLKKAITIESCLTMTSGLDWNNDNTYLMQTSGDWVRYVLNLPMKTIPLQRFVYNNGGVHLLSAVIAYRRKMNTLDYAQIKLFEPLGINKPYWYSDPMGHPAGYGGLRLCPIDMAKIGVLYQNQGFWKGRQILPTNWIAESVQARVLDKERGEYYGYLLWLNRFGGYRAEGAGGQYIIVIPEQKLVVVYTANFRIDQMQTPLQLTTRYIQPAIIQNKSIPENYDNNRELQALVKKLSQPQKKPVSKIPADFLKLSKRRMKLAEMNMSVIFSINQQNSEPIKDFMLDFSKPDEVWLLLTLTNKSITLKAGLDNVPRFSEFPKNGSDILVRYASVARWTTNNTLLFRAHNMDISQDELYEIGFSGGNLYFRVFSDVLNRIVFYYSVEN